MKTIARHFLDLMKRAAGCGEPTAETYDQQMADAVYAAVLERAIHNDISNPMHYDPVAAAWRARPDPTIHLMGPDTWDQFPVGARFYDDVGQQGRVLAHRLYVRYDLGYCTTADPADLTRDWSAEP